MSRGFPGFNDAQVKSILAEAIRFWDDATQAHDSFFQDTNDREKMANGLLPSDIAAAYEPYPDKSCLAPPDFFINLASLEAAISNLIYGSKPYGICSIPGDPNRVDGLADKASNVLQWQNDLSDDESNSTLAVKQALYAGRGCTFTGWRIKQDYDIERYSPGGPFILDKNGVPIKKQTVVASYAETVPIDIRRVRIDPSVDRIEDRKIVGRQFISHMSKLLNLNSNKGHFYNFDKTELDQTSFPDSYYRYINSESDLLTSDESIGYGDRIIEIKEIRGIFKVDRGGTIHYEDLIVHIGNGTVLLGVKHNDLPIPGYELFDFPAVDRTLGRVFPMGVIEPAQDLWMYLFLLMNNIIDQNNRKTFEMYLADKAAVEGMDENIQFEGGKIIAVDSTYSQHGVSDVFTPLVSHGSTIEPTNLMMIFKNMIQQVMKLNDYIQAQDPSRKETATAVEALVQGGHSLLIHLVNNLKSSYYAPSWQKKLKLFNFFEGHNLHKITNNDGVETVIKPGEINQLWKVDIDTNANMDRPSTVRRLVEMFPILSKNPYVDQRSLVETLVQVTKLPNETKLIVSDEVTEFQADKENIAMASGVDMPVHPAEKHELHIKAHSEFLDSQQQVLDGKAVELIQNHIQEHQAILDKQNSGLGNTKELGANAGGSNGQQASPAQPAGRNG